MRREGSSLADIARIAGTSRVTVSRVLSGARLRGRGASPELHDRILKAARQLGYRPHHAARALIKRRAFSIGYATREAEYLRGHFFSQILAGVCASGAQHGQNVQCLVTEKPRTDHVGGNFFLDKIADHSVDGVVIYDLAVDLEYLHWLHENHVPFAFIDGRWPGFEDRGVLLDREGVGRTAFSYLRSLGHERIAMIAPTGSLFWEPNDRLCEGFESAAREAGLSGAQAPVLRYDASDWTATASSVEPESVALDWGPWHPSLWGERGEFRETIEQLLSSGQPPTAIFVDSDPLAHYLIHLLGEMGRQVPGDAAVLGVGNRPMAAVVRPQISTFRDPWYDMGIAATEFVLRLMEDPSASPPPPLPCELVVRESCGGQGRV